MKHTKPSGIYEKEVLSTYNDGYEKDDLGKSIPRRLLTNFQFRFVESGDKAPLESMNTTPLLGEGTVTHSGEKDLAVHFVATEWSIEYGVIIQLQDTPQLWVKSRSCWYKLQEASSEYNELFQPTIKRAALCTALVDIIDTLHASDSDSESETGSDGAGDYTTVLSELLSRNKTFTEQYLLDNRDFIIRQLKSAHIPADIFIKGLKRNSRKPVPPKDAASSFLPSSNKNSSSSKKLTTPQKTQRSTKKRNHSDLSSEAEQESESPKKKGKPPRDETSSNSSSESSSDSSGSSDSDSDSSSDSSSDASGERNTSKAKNDKKVVSKNGGTKGSNNKSGASLTSKQKNAEKTKAKKERGKDKEKAKKEKEKAKEKVKKEKEKAKKEKEKEKTKQLREKQLEDEKERKRIEKEKLKEEAKRYPMDDMLLEKKLQKEGKPILAFPAPDPLPFPAPHYAIGGVLLVWEFANTFRKIIGLARNSFTAEDLASGLCPTPLPEHLTLVVQIHVALLSFLLAEGRTDDDSDEKPHKVPERLRLAYEQLRKVPITHSTWFEVLRQFMQLLHEEADQEEQEEGNVGSDGDTKQYRKKTKFSTRGSVVVDAVHSLGTMEYEALLLEHKLALLETLCYEASNTPLFRQHIAQHVETVDALRKEKRVEELKLKEKRKVIESNVKKLAAEQRDKDSADTPASTDSKSPSSEKASRQLALQLKEEEERASRQANSEQRKLEVEQKRLEYAKRAEGRSIKAAEAKFTSAIIKETRLLRTQCMGQDRHFRRYWIFAGGKGRGFCAGRLLVEHIYPYSAVVNEQDAQEGSKSIRWSYYPDKEKLMEFIGMLNQKGVRELGLYKSLMSVASELRAYGTETNSYTEKSTLTDIEVDYKPPSLERLRASLLDFADRLPDGVHDPVTLEKRFADCKGDTVSELAKLLHELELHLTDTMLTEEWCEHRDEWRRSVNAAATTAHVAVLLSQLETAVKLIDNARGCTVCRGTGDEAHLLLCDTCEDEYHTYCLHPPLTGIPRGDWVCPSCKERRPDENDDLCTVCRSRGELLCCDYCSRAYHLKCVDPPLSSIPRGKWGCMHCVESLPTKKRKEVDKKSARNLVTRISTRSRRSLPRPDYSEL